MAAIAEIRTTVTDKDLTELDLNDPLDLDTHSVDADDDDLWDLISDEDGRDSGYLSPNEFDTSTGPIASGSSDDAYGHTWLAQHCAEATSRGAGLDAQALEQQVLAVLASDSSGKYDISWEQTLANNFQMRSFKSCLLILWDMNLSIWLSN